MTRALQIHEFSSTSNVTTLTTVQSLVLGTASTELEPWDLVLVAVMLKSTSAEVTAISYADGTWERVRRQVGTNMALELWVGYDFSGTVADNGMLITHGSSAGMARAVKVSRAGAPITSSPTIVAQVGETGASGPAAPGAILPTQADESQQVISVLTWLNGTAATYSYTPTLGGPQISTVLYSTVQSMSFLIRRVSEAVEHTVSGTTAAEWAAVSIVVDMPDPTAHVNSHVYKGRAKKSLDTAGAA